MNWETSIDIYTHKHIYIHTHRESEMLRQPLGRSGERFEQTKAHSEGQGCLAFCSPWIRKELDKTQ